MSSSAELKRFVLSPSFDSFGKAEFVEVYGDHGRIIKGDLVYPDGNRFSLPNTCGFEVGPAELKDAFTVKGKNTYFLFVCAWSVRHAGLGLSGTQYEFFVYSNTDLEEIENLSLFSRVLSGYEGVEGGA